MKKVTLKKVAAIAMSMLMVLGMAACSSDETTDESAGKDAEAEVDFENSERIQEIKDSGKLVMGTSADYPPFEFHTKIDGEDTIVGFDIAIAQKVADSLGVELEVVDMAFDSLLISLNNGDFDMVMASLTPDPERSKAVDFSDKYYQGSQVVLVRAEDADKYTTKESLEGHKVTAQKGAIQVPLAIDVAGEENVVQLVKVGDMVTELLNDKVDAVFLDSVIAAGYQAMNEDLVMVDIGIEYESDGNCVAVKKGDTDLVAFINDVLSKMSEDEINQLLLDAQKVAGIAEEESAEESAE